MAQEICQLLQVTHKGTSQVKESKISLLTSVDEAFKMEGETTNTIYNRFNDIIASLQNLNKKLGLNELNKNLLASLPIEQRPKVTTIEKANLMTITMQESLGSPITHKHTLEKDNREKEVSKIKKKDFAL